MTFKKHIIIFFCLTLAIFTLSTVARDNYEDTITTRTDIDKDLYERQQKVDKREIKTPLQSILNEDTENDYFLYKRFSKPQLQSK